MACRVKDHDGADLHWSECCGLLFVSRDRAEAHEVRCTLLTTYEAGT